MPVTRQTLAIIENRGDIGAAVARGTVRGNYRLLLVNQDRERNERLADELRSINPEADVELLSCSHTGCWEADTIIVSVEANEWRTISQKIEEVSTQKVVLGALDFETGQTAIDLQKSLPHSKVVQVTTTEAADFSGERDSRVLELRSVHEDALETASRLLSAAGYHPVPELVTS